MAEQDEAHLATAGPSAWQAGAFLPPFFTPSSQARTGQTQISDFCTAKSSEPEPSCSPSTAMSTHRLVSQHSRSVPCRDPFKAVRSVRVRHPSPLFLFSPSFLYSCLYVSTYFYTNKTSDRVEDLLKPELAKQTNHRPDTLNPTAAVTGMFQEDSCIVPACDVRTPHHAWATGWIPLQWGSPSDLGSLSSPNHSGRKVPVGFHLKGWKLPSGPTALLIAPRH